MKKTLLAAVLALCSCGGSNESGLDAATVAGLDAAAVASPDASAGSPDAGSTSARYWFEQAYALTSADIDCAADEDCCVVVDGCNSSALIVSKADQAAARAGIDRAYALATGAGSDSPCNDCIVPAVVARCVSGKCVGHKLYCTLGCLGDAGVPDADTTDWCTTGEAYVGDFSAQDHCGTELAIPAGVTDDPECGGGGSGGSYSFGCSPY